MRSLIGPSSTRLPYSYRPFSHSIFPGAVSTAIFDVTKVTERRLVSTTIPDRMIYMETIEVQLSPEEVRAIGSALAKHVEFSAFKAWSRFGITRALLAKVHLASLQADDGPHAELAVALADPDWDRAGAWPARPDAQGRYRNA